MIYGRRQIGKTTMIREFCRGKDALIIQSNDVSAYENRTRMAMDISLFLGRDVTGCDTYTGLLAAISDACRTRRMVVVFDEYSYLARTSPEFSSILQRMIDEDLADTDTMLIICGSSISIMRNEVESAERPLYGRFMNRMEVGPLSLKECMGFHEGMPAIDALKVYMTVGGIPKYHSVTDATTYRDYVTGCFLDRDAPLIHEAEAVVSNELTPAHTYSGIVANIADGTVRQHEIADRMGMERPSCKMCLDRLEFIGLMERLHPMMGAPRRPVYRIRDNLTAFFYEVLRRNMTLIEGQADPGTKFDAVSHDIDTFLGKRFEDVCGDYVDRAFDVKERGRWWGRSDGEGTDIDIVAKVYDGDGKVENLFCECKFTRKPMGMGAFNELAGTVGGLGPDNPRYALFSLNGFDEKLMDYAEDTGIVLVDIDGLLQ